MRYLTDNEYQAELIKAERKKENYKRKAEIRKIKAECRPKVETSKMLAFYLFVLLNAIIIYSMVAMWVFRDFTYLGVLISDIAAQVVIYAVYCVKAYKGKKEEEFIKLEREKLSGGVVIDSPVIRDENIEFEDASHV